LLTLARTLERPLLDEEDTEDGANGSSQHYFEEPVHAEPLPEHQAICAITARKHQF
jgi:hypothetical protein